MSSDPHEHDNQPVDRQGKLHGKQDERKEQHASHMKRVLSTVSCLALCAVPLLAQKKAARTAPMSDQQFINFAAQTDMVEANLGQLAQNVAASQTVKDYAQMLETDHVANYKELRTLAPQANVTVPDAIDSQNNRALIGPMYKLKGKVFDRRYIHAMIVGHTKAIAIFKKEAEGATEPAIKSYAQDSIPVLQKHLDDAKAIAQGKTPPNL
jgi:putative membrane protein